MKKFLSRIFSVVLVAATVASPSMAQLAKRAAAPKSEAKTTAVTAKAIQAPAKAAKGSMFNQCKTRSFEGKSSSVFASKKTVKGINRSLNAPAKEAGNMPELNGILAYSDAVASTELLGLYSVPTNGNSSATPIVTGFQANGGVYVDGIYYATGYTSFWGYIMSIDLYEVDIEAGEFTQVGLPDEDLSFIINAMAQDPTTGIIYGIGYNGQGNGLQLKTINFNGASSTASVICNCDRNWNTITFDKDGQLWGISYDGEQDAEGNFTVTSSALCKIDKATGAVTEVGDTGVLPEYLSSGCIDKASGRFFWNVCPADETGWMYEVNLSTGAATPLYQLKDNDEIMGMYAPAPAAADGAPAACENVELDFTGASLTGNVNLTAPAGLFDGSNGSGNVTIHVLVNGEDNATATAAYGAEVSVPVTVAEAGLYTFTVYASNAVGDGPKKNIKNEWIGADTPSATTATLAYENGAMTVSWTAVTGSVNGGYINLDNLTYTVKDMDGNVKAEGLTTTSWSEEVAEPVGMVRYQYQVIAVCDGASSQPALTNAVTIGSGVIPPYTSNFEADGLGGWTIIDGNEDNKVWSVYNGNLRIAWNSSKDMDDWAITMPIKLEAGKAYSFSCYTWSGTAYEETIEIKYGQQPTVAGMTETLLPPTSVKVGESGKIAVENMILPQTSGDYYIGFHGMSAKDKFYLYVSDFSIGEGTSTAAPGLGEIEAIADPNGGKFTTLNVTYPSKTMGGADLSSLTKAEIYNGETLIKTVENPAVGGTATFTDNVTENGNYSYTLVCYNSEGKGLVAHSESVYVGFMKPKDITSVDIERTATVGEVLVSWPAVTTDINGKTYPAGSVKYSVQRYSGGNWLSIADDIEATSYTYQAVEADTQAFVQVAVIPSYDGMTATGTVSDMIPVGKAYKSIDETFADGSLSYIWGMDATGEGSLEGVGGGEVSIANQNSFQGINGVNDDNGFVSIKTATLNSSAMFFSGMVDIADLTTPGLTFYVYNIQNGTDANLNIINAYVKDLSTPGSEWTCLDTKPVYEIAGGTNESEAGEDGWYKVTVNLNAYAGKTIQVGIEAVCKAYQYNLIDNIKVADLLSYDLKAVSINAPAKVKGGDSYTVDVRVSNEGAKEVASYSVELYANDDLVETKNCSALASAAMTTVSFEQVMSPVNQETIKYYAKVVYEADEAPDDNTTGTIEVSPILSKLPAPTDLEGTSVSEGIKLTWNEPNLESPANAAPAPITEDFEDADGVQSEYGDWTFVDEDGDAVGGFQDQSGAALPIPGITIGETTGSFWTWDNDVIDWASGNQTYQAHSGSKYLFALFNYEGSNSDDWAISPSLYGGPQTISFFAKSYSSQYPEQIEVYYSLGDKEISDFVAVENSKVFPVPNVWTEYTYELPAGANYFAIRSYGQNAFMLMIDDVTFTPGDGSGANLELKGYNVYRDGVKINDALVEETEFVDTNVVEGQQYTYIVTAVYEERGESALSNEAVVTYNYDGVDGVAEGQVKVFVENSNLVVLNAADKNVIVSNANGAVVYSGAGESRTVVPVSNGVYVVKVDRLVKKVIVK
ncbi:MAG: choice-of-anchor J domain-containing protein [Muribaculaceae bacterium]|nr:choice-of-anchor J domain-containing protein [Muribaculaceae bacterium]